MLGPSSYSYLLAKIVSCWRANSHRLSSGWYSLKRVLRRHLQTKIFLWPWRLRNHAKPGLWRHSRTILYPKHGKHDNHANPNVTHSLTLSIMYRDIWRHWKDWQAFNFETSWRRWLLGAKKCEYERSHFLNTKKPRIEHASLLWRLFGSWQIRCRKLGSRTYTGYDVIYLSSC